MAANEEHPIGSSNVMLSSRELAKEFSDLKVASEYELPKFSGEAGQAVEQWIRTYERVGRAFEWDDRKMLKQVPLYLVSFAGYWYDKETDNGKLKPLPWKSWDDFMKALTLRFRPRDQTQRYK